jgi:hypothetical protein
MRWEGHIARRRKGTIHIVFWFNLNEIYHMGKNWAQMREWYCLVFGCVTRLITSRCQGPSGFLLSFTYTLVQSLLLSRYLSGGYLPSLSSMAASLDSCLPSDTLSVILLVSSAYIGVLRTGYETPFAKVRSPVFGTPLLRKRLVSSVVTICRCGNSAISIVVVSMEVSL